jgi:hypothetical protein
MPFEGERAFGWSRAKEKERGKDDKDKRLGLFLIMTQPKIARPSFLMSITFSFLFTPTPPSPFLELAPRDELRGAGGTFL